MAKFTNWNDLASYKGVHIQPTRSNMRISLNATGEARKPVVYLNATGKDSHGRHVFLQLPVNETQLAEVRDWINDYLGR